MVFKRTALTPEIAELSGLLNIKARQIAEMSTRLKTLQSNTDRVVSVVSSPNVAADFVKVVLA